ncbi:MAG: inositol monophosphatase family protein [Victivallaceae bacterium]
MIEFIKTLALEAGEIALRERKTLDAGKIFAKDSDKDMVTAVDRQIEDFLISRIHEKFPAHDIFGEETGRSGNSSRYCWALDPIDGTTSYIHDQPYYSVSIGFQENGITTHGAVYAPRLGELFTAQKGVGAWLNGEKIAVSPRNRLSESLLGTGFACIRANLMENNLKYFVRMMPLIRGIRRCGSAAIDLSYVACGRLEGFWELNLNLYDIAAGALILEEAGGKITDLTGGADYPEKGLVSSNRLIHDELLTRLHEA